MQRGSRAAQRQPRSAEGGAAQATPRPAPGGAGAAGAQELPRWVGAKGEGRQKAYSTRYSQAISHPSTNQARSCLASEIRQDRALSGWHGHRRRRLPPGILRALCCASLSLSPASQASRQHLSTGARTVLEPHDRDQVSGLPTPPCP